LVVVKKSGAWRWRRFLTRRWDGVRAESDNREVCVEGERSDLSTKLEALERKMQK